MYMYIDLRYTLVNHSHIVKLHFYLVRKRNKEKELRKRNKEKGTQKKESRKRSEEIEIKKKRNGGIENNLFILIVYLLNS